MNKDDYLNVSVIIHLIVNQCLMHKTASNAGGCDKLVVKFYCVYFGEDYGVLTCWKLAD